MSGVGKRRSGGRAARLAVRQFEQTAQARQMLPPIGGQYRPLSDTDLIRIIDAAFAILADIGVSDVPPLLAETAMRQGCRFEDGRIYFSRDFSEDIIAGAAKNFVLHGQDARHDIEVGGDLVHFGTGGAGVQTFNPKDNTYRASTLRDLYDFARLADALPNIRWFTRCCVATDVPDNLDLDINTAYAIARGTQKPIGTSFFLGRHVEPAIRMFDTILGGDRAFERRPFCKVHISPIISPLRYGEDAFDVALEAMRFGMPINAIIACQSGATGPAPLAGMLAQSTAETLAALIMVNLFRPGYPVIFSNWPFVIDLRTGAFSGGGAEIAVMNAAAAQISNALGLPSGVSAAMADSKAYDAQAGAEKAMTLMAAGMSGANMVYESAGMMASLMGVSAEAMVGDDEIIGQITRAIHGVTVNDDTLNIEVIRQVVEGAGHFLGHDQTISQMQKEYHYPDLFDREPIALWAESGASSLAGRSRQRAAELLAKPAPSWSAAIDVRLRDEYRILLRNI